MQILTVADSYPSDVSPWGGTFVHTLMRALQVHGVEVAVVAPVSLTGLLKPHSFLQMPDFYEIREGVSVWRPRFVSFSNLSLPWGGTTFRWMMSNFIKAAQRAVSKSAITPDVCYGHFLYPAGATAVAVARRLGVPCVLSLGESRYFLYEDNYGVEEVSRLVSSFDGIIAVNSQIKERCVSRYGASPERIVVLPNGVDTSTFYPRDRIEMRRKLGLPERRPLIAFVGHFDENKGPRRVLSAIQQRPEIGAIFLGSGRQVPKGPQVLYRGRVSPEQVPEWLSAADLFVLPTLSEGSCNAILEALACGLPIVSSDRSFNHEILDSSVSILVDPLDVKALEAAITALVTDPERRHAMGEVARQRALRFNITARAHRILKWLREIGIGIC